ncbi:MAG: DNA recombination protein RmuC [Magnetospirillum sp. WYHS-4]
MADSMIAMLLGALLAMAGAALVLLVVRRGGSDRLDPLVQAVERLAGIQGEQAGRLHQLAEDQANAQGQLARRLEERLEVVSRRVGDGLSEHARNTGETMSRLHERLALIDAAQKNLADLSQQMVGLQDILSNKQARGAFGEIQLNDLVSKALPPFAYEVQARLSNGKIADCLLKLPNPPGSIAIDAKFPLESYRLLTEARDEVARVQASRAFSADVLTHVKAIAEKYIVAGETAESALMFLPSEAIYAELHANFRNVVEESFRRRVWIVSPTTLMATLNTVRAVLKDARMREQAGLIQKEVLELLKDVARLDERVESLQKHFGQAGKDIGEIRISADKIVQRGEKVESLQLGEDSPAADLPPPRT